MDQALLRNELPLSVDNRQNDYSLLTFDLPKLIEDIKQSNAWASGELNHCKRQLTTGKKITAGC